LIGSPFWDDQRSFRDYLRAHPETAADHARLKQALAGRYPTDRLAYIENKTVFVAAVRPRA